MLGVTRHEKHFRLGMKALEITGQLGTALARQDNVGQQQIDRRAAALGILDRLERIADRVHRVAVA